MRRLWLIAALAAASLHCGNEEDAAPDPSVVDADGDGVFASEDCDDAAGDRWRRLPGFRDADGDLVGAGAEVQVCTGESLRAGWVATGGDCDDANPARWTLAEAYGDADGDGAAEEPLAAVCMGDVLPAGWADAPSDCAPGDASRWQQLAYLYRDADGDTFTVAQAGTVCGGPLLPSGHGMEPTGDDCDDTDRALFLRTSAFADGDRDGVGGAAGTACTAGAGLPPGWAWQGGDCDDAEARAWQLVWAYRDADGDGRGREGGEVCGAHGWLPPGWSGNSSDCDDSDPAVWAAQTHLYADRDGDGRAVSSVGTVCAVTLPVELRASLGGWSAGDCDDADAARWSAVTLYADVDGDGRGAGAGAESCVGAALPAGSATSASDCAPDDGTRWGFLQYWSRDLDGDGRSVPPYAHAPYSSGTVCTGNVLPSGYSTSSPAAPYDCDDANAALWIARQGAPDEDGDGFGEGALAPVCSADALPAGYASIGNDCATADPGLWRWTVLYPDADGDGVGAPPREIHCLGATIPAGWSERGWDSNDGDPGVVEGEGPLALDW